MKKYLLQFALFGLLVIGSAILRGCSPLENEKHREAFYQSDSVARKAWQIRRNQPHVADSLSRSILHAASYSLLPDSTKAQLWKNISAIHWFSGRLDSANNTTDSALHYYHKAGDTIEYGNTLNLKGLVAWHSASYDSALSSFGKAYTVFTQVPDSDGMMIVLANMAIIYYQLGDYDSAMALLTTVTPYNESKGRNQALADNYTNLAIILGVQKDMGKSLYYKRRSLDMSILLEDQRAILLSLANLGTHFYNDSRYDSSHYYNKQALQLAVTLGDKLTEGFLYNNMAETFIALGNYFAADTCVKKAISIREYLNDPLGLGISYRIYGILLESKGRTAEALPYFEKALALAKQIGSKEQQMNVNEQLYETYTKRGEFKKALEYKQAAGVLRDSLFSQAQNERIQRLQIRYESMQKDKALLEQELKLVKLQYENRTTKFRLYFIVVLALFGMILLVLYGLYQRRKAEQEAIKREKENEINLLTMQKAELEQKRLEDEIVYKNKEITTLALMLSDKRNMVLEIEQQVHALLEYSQSEVNQKLGQLLKDLRIRRTMERETSDFESYIDEVCNGFFIKLQERFPAMSQSEKRLAALLRMNLSSKEIAGILNISPKSVDMGRYRLRKKLGLETEEGLYESLLNI
jgi:tetratricopeptide (TPR) repeat protein